MKIDPNFVSYLCARFVDKSQKFVSREECICTVLEAVEAYENKVTKEVKNEILLKEQRDAAKRISKQSKMF